MVQRSIQRAVPAYDRRNGQRADDRGVGTVSEGLKTYSLQALSVRAGSGTENWAALEVQ